MDKSLIDMLKTKALIYTINLVSFTQIYDISGKKNMMKCILSPGKGVDKPGENDEIVFNYSIKVNGDIITRRDKIKTLLSELNEAEVIMLKSMKKGEKASVEISRGYLEDVLPQNSCILDEEIRQHVSNKSGRIIYELEILYFKTLFTEYEINGVTYQRHRVMKGIGNQCPWKKALVLIAMEVKRDGVVIHTDFSNNLLGRLKEIKTKTKLIPLFEKNLQFLLDPEIEKLGKFHIYDLYTYLLPEFLTECIVTMKLLEVQRVNFTGDIDYLKVGQSIIKGIGEYEITVCLLNYQECFNFFNKSMQSMSDIYNKITEYRELANGYFKQDHLEKAKGINKFLVDEYVKYINLKDKGILNYNKLETKQNVNIEISDLTDDMKLELKKAHSNLIIILYRLKEFKLCDEYIELFFVVQNSDDEKVVYTKFKLLYEQKKFEESEVYLARLENSKPELYRDELKELREKIRINVLNKDNFIKKMFTMG
jgi:hypothetical protein